MNKNREKLRKKFSVFRNERKIYMEENNKIKRNHWTQNKVDTACKKINQEIYGRNRQAPIHLKLDDLSIFINSRITRRGIAKGMITIQEDLNMNILEIEKKTMEVLITNNKKTQYEILLKIKNIIKIEIWTDIRFLMINKAITPGEISELIRRQIEIDNDLEKWIISIQKAISAEG